MGSNSTCAAMVHLQYLTEHVLQQHIYRTIQYMCCNCAVMCCKCAVNVLLMCRKCAVNVLHT